MSQINNSYEYYQSNQGLLSMLNNKKGGNALINQLISNNEMKYQQKMEAYGISTDSSNNKYKNVDKAANNLLDALEKLSDEDLYKANEGTEVDKTDILKKVNNYVTAYNSTITNLKNCGGALNNSFKTEFEEIFKNSSEEFANIGITKSADNKLVVDDEKLLNANIEDIKALFGADANYNKNVLASATSINTILGKALSMSSTNYNSLGIMNF